MKYIFIVNPTSGKGKGLRAGNAIKEYCQSININYEIIFTNKKEDATNIAKHFCTNNDNIIYSVGGDGTLNEIINGIDIPKTNINIIPVGSGNDFYKSIKNHTECDLDIGIVNGKKFINIASIGLDANIADKANKLKKYKLPSSSIYLLGLITEYFRYNGNNIVINGDKYNNNILAICNGKYYGGGFKIGPLANISDGSFDICQVNYNNKLNSLMLLCKLIKGNHYKNKNIKYYNDKKIIIDSDIELPCNIDGEIIYDNHYEFEILPSFLHFGNDPLNINKELKIKKLIK